MKLTLLAMMVISSVSFAQVTPELCQVAYNGRATDQRIAKSQSSGFYDKASRYAKENHVCVKADLAGTNEGVRVYDVDGSRIGGKSGSQFDDLSQSAGRNCVSMTCLALVDSKAQTGAGYGTSPVQSGTIIVTPSTPVVVSGSEDF